MRTLTVGGFEFEYSDPRESSLQCERRWYSWVIAPKHGLVMGSLVYFGDTQPSEQRIIFRVTAEARWHIKVANVKTPICQS